MHSRDRLHTLIDTLPEDKLQVALEFLERLGTADAADRLTEAMNRVVDEVGSGSDKFSERAPFAYWSASSGDPYEVWD